MEKIEIHSTRLEGKPHSGSGCSSKYL